MITFIVCVDTQYAIGNENKLLYNFKEDMKRFKKLTKDKIVVVGNNTWKSLPNKLPNRKVIVLSNNIIEDVYSCTNNINYILDISKTQNVYIIGGANVYYQFKDYVDCIELTLVSGYKKYDTDIKWLESLLKEYEIINTQTLFDTDRTDNITKKISFITYIK